MSIDTSANTGCPEEKQLCEQPHPDSRRGQDTYSEKLELTVFPTSVFTSAGWCRDSPAPDKDLLFSFLFLFPAIFTTDSTCNVARAVRLLPDTFVFIVRSRLDKLLFVYFRDTALEQVINYRTNERSDSLASQLVKAFF